MNRDDLLEKYYDQIEELLAKYGDRITIENDVLEMRLLTEAQIEFCLAYS